MIIFPSTLMVHTKCLLGSWHSPEIETTVGLLWNLTKNDIVINCHSGLIVFGELRVNRMELPLFYINYWSKQRVIATLICASNKVVRSLWSISNHGEAWFFSQWHFKPRLHYALRLRLFSTAALTRRWLQLHWRDFLAVTQRQWPWPWESETELGSPLRSACMKV